MSEDPCEVCGQEHEFIVLMEGEEDWAKSETKKLCGNCLHEAKGVIEAWTLTEWKNQE